MLFFFQLVLVNRQRLKLQPYLWADVGFSQRLRFLREVWNNSIVQAAFSEASACGRLVLGKVMGN